MKDNVSRDLIDYFERSTARVNAAEARRVRRLRVRKAIVAAVLFGAFLGGAYLSCSVRLP